MLPGHCQVTILLCEGREYGGRQAENSKNSPKRCSLTPTAPMLSVLGNIKYIKHKLYMKYFITLHLYVN